MEKIFKYSLATFLPFRDIKACEKARAIRKEDLVRHPRKNVEIRIIEDDAAFLFAWALDIVGNIKKAAEEGRRHVIILPAPNPQYALVAQMINQLGISCKHVHTFNMDEYADQDGNTAPRDWRGGFQYWMWHDFFDRINPELRIPEKQIHFPSTKTVGDYSRMLEDMGGADICYGGIGWSGHIAFFEPHLGEEFGNDINAYLQAGSRIVDLNPITICQNTLYADAGGAGDWSWNPPKAATIGPRDLKNSKLVNFYNGFSVGDISWQRFITRLSMYGPVTPLVPASILQLLNTRLTLSGEVANDCSQDTVERRVPIAFPGTRKKEL